MALVTLSKYKTAIKETSSSNDQFHQDALDDASAAVAAYTDRDLGVATATADRTFFYDGSGFLEIDDASAVNSVRFDTQATALDSATWEAFRDGPAGVPYSYLVLPGPYRVSGEMGFTYNLDQWLARSGGFNQETRVIVNATWGWATVPNDIQRATIWTASAYEAMSESAGGTMSSHSVADVSTSYVFNAAASNPDAQSDIPPRAKAILEQYRRHVL